MSNHIPEYIDPLHLADKRGVLRGQMIVDGFDRVADLLYDDTGTVAIDLAFARHGAVVRVEGRFEADLLLKCQNCLQALPWQIGSEIKLGVVTSIDQLDKLTDGYEPLLITEGQKVLLKDIIEDELLLSLPTFPKHSFNCFEQSANQYGQFLSDPQEDSDSNVNNPFSILAKLKNTGD